MQLSNHKRRLSGLLLLTVLLVHESCVKEIDDYQPQSGPITEVSDMMQMQVPASFTYEIDREVGLEIQLRNNDNKPLAGVHVDIMTDIPENGGDILYSGTSTPTGHITGKFRAHRDIRQVIVNTDYIGLPNNALADISGNTISMKLGGSNPDRITCRDYYRASGDQNAGLRTTSVPPKLYLGTWNSQGAPDYLSQPRDIITNDFLTRINNSLPERGNVPQQNPQYLSANALANAELTEQADVWITFVHEGAGYRNTLGYYVYHKNNPPQSPAHINNIRIVFPNMSYANSGGGLVSGDKVYLGNFGPDSIIGFVLLANAYNINNNTVGNGLGAYYSNPNLNPESNPADQPHHVALWDDTEQKMVVGFEDLNRNSGSDDDFNDAVFYVSSNPSNAISNQRLAPTCGHTDTDGDGIQDSMDDYPLDADLATNNYYPSRDGFGQLCFEDLWPYRGDYDMNDAIIGYNYNVIKDGYNQVRQIQARFFVKAAGGSYRHGFGFELPLPPSAIEYVSGNVLTESYINLNGNGTEAAQSKAVIIVFDNSNSVAPRPAGYYVNTEPGSPAVGSDTLRISIQLKNPELPAVLGSAPFNPFLISNMQRGNEIHLPDKTPTDLANTSLFNTGQDVTNQAMGRFYRSSSNLPWCINIPASAPIVAEKNQFIAGYLKFSLWAQSGGVQYNDWYEDKSGYRDPSRLIYR